MVKETEQVKTIAKIDTDRIKSCLLELHMDKEEFAKALGISIGTLSNKMSGYRSWTLDDMIVIIRLFNKPLEFFLL